MKKFKKSDIGRWVTVKWNDVGRRDCVLVELNHDKTRATVFEPYGELHGITGDQLVEKRDYLNAA